MFGSYKLAACARCLALAMCVITVGLARPARADSSTAHTVSVAVLSFDSDDAEEQSDALTGALRSRIRASQGWSLLETSQSLGMLAAALRCPVKPISADCEQRIADQIKSERFIFGYVTKGPQAGQVSAEVHLYQRSKPETVIRETYADNLKDQNDDNLRKVAQHVLDRLGGHAVGTIAVHMGTENGEVVVDGDKRVPLQNGNARLELSPGGHSVEVAVTGQPPQKRNVLVTAGKETVIEIPLASTPAVAEPPKPEKPFPTRTVVGGALAAVGVAAGTVAVLNLLSYLDDQDEAKKFQDGPTNPNEPKLPPNRTADEACGNELRDEALICKINSRANRHSAIAWGTGIGAVVFLGAGAYFILSDSSSDKSASAKKPRVIPTIGYGSGGLVVSGSF